ncbi:MAG: PKD domain-containing protein [Bacteroidota bacterium]
MEIRKLKKWKWRSVLLSFTFLMLLTSSLAQVNVNITHITDGNAGSIKLLGQPAPSYIWTGPHPFYSTERDIMNLTVAGEYCVVITGSDGCLAGGCFELRDLRQEEEDFLAQFRYAFDADPCQVNFSDQSNPGPGIDSWFWTFGDGATSTSQNPIHWYTEAGTFPVTLTITDVNGNVSTHSEDVQVISCGDIGSTGELSCNIIGTTQATVGADVQLEAFASGGTPPYSFDWSVNTLYATPGSATGSSNVFTLDAGLSNTDEVTFRLTVSDANGQQTTCVHYVDISGAVPSPNVQVFGTFAPDGYMYFATFLDRFNIVGQECYEYDFYEYTNTSSKVPLETDLECQLLDYDFDDITFAAGFFQVCVTVVDDVGRYTDCEDFTIGNPPSLPPPTAFHIEHRTPEGTWARGAFSLPNCVGGQGLRIVEGDSPFGNVAEYFLQWEYRISGTVNWIPLGNAYHIYRVSGDQGINFFPDPSTPLNTCIDFRVQICSYIPGGQICTGDIAVHEHACAGTIVAAEMEFSTIQVNTVNSCNTYLSIDAACGYPEQTPITAGPCDGQHQPYVSYEWKAFDVNDPTTEVVGLLGDDPFRCVDVSTGHSYFDQFINGDALFYGEVIVTDGEGNQAMHRELVSMPIPLRVNLEQSITRCAGQPVYLGLGALVTGGTGNYEYSWTGPNGFTSDDPNPVVTAPAAGVTENYALFVFDGTCMETGTVVVKGVELELELGDPNLLGCSPESFIDLGPEDLNTIGGSGQYEFLWTATDHTGANYPVPNATDPQIRVRPDRSLSVTYKLLITDLIGHCTVTDLVIVTRGSIDPVAVAGQDQSACYGQELVLGSPENGNGTLGTPIITWTSDNPRFQGSNDPVLTLSESLNRYPGTYTYTLRVEDERWKCANEDEVVVEVLPTWLHRGYESRLTAVVPDGTEVDAWNYPNSQNTIYASNVPAGDPIFDARSGAQSPFTYTWDPADGITTTGYKGDRYPYRAEFDAQLHPMHTLKVTDASTCENEYPTNKYLLFEREVPTGDIQITRPSSEQCDDFVICANLTIDLHYLGGAPLPTFLYADLFLTKPPSASTYFDQLLRMQLVDEATGIYKTQVCIPRSAINGVSGDFQLTLHYSNTTSTQFKDYNNIWHFFTSHNDLATKLFQVVGRQQQQVPYALCVAGNVAHPWWYGAMTVASPRPHNYVSACVGNSATVSREMYGINFAGGRCVLLTPGFHAKSGADFWAYIDPCLELEEGLMAEAEEPEIDPSFEREEEEGLARDLSIAPNQGLDLLIAPNPFATTVQITYNITTQKNAQVRLSVFSLTGQEVALLVDEKSVADGVYHHTFDTSDLPSGIYFCELVVNNKRLTRRMIKI